MRENEHRKFTETCEWVTDRDTQYLIQKLLDDNLVLTQRIESLEAKMYEGR